MCEDGNINALQNVLKLNTVDINTQDYSGNTVLHQATQATNYECCDLLLKDNTIDLHVRQQIFWMRINN